MVGGGGKYTITLMIVMMVEMIIGENDNDEKVSSGLGGWGRWGVVYGDLPFPDPNCLVPDVGNAMINIWDIVF